jgi:hypothetical protein
MTMPRSRVRSRVGPLAFAALIALDWLGAAHAQAIKPGTSTTLMGTLNAGWAASTTSTPSNPSSTSLTAGVMMGLAGALTPVASTQALVVVTGSVNNTTSGDGSTVQCRYGTGSAPANGASPTTGTALGNPVKFVNASSASELVPFVCIGIATGLAPNVPIWIDVALASVTGGTSTISGITIAAHEL